MKPTVYELKFRLEASQEIEQAIDYYLKISPQVAFLFDEDLENSFTILKNSPFFQIRILNYRVLPLNSFPFIIIFQVLEDIKVVDIISIFHSAQNPEKYPLK